MTIAPLEGRGIAENESKPGRLSVAAARFFQSRSLGWFALLVLVMVWEVVAQVSPSPGLPAPSRIAAAWWREMTVGQLRWQLADTMISMAYGFVLSTIFGVVIGVVMAWVRVFYALMEPLVELLRPIPTIIFVPVIILYVGLGREMNVIAILISATIPILIASYAGARGVSAALRDTAATFNLSWWQTVREIVVPAAAPEIFIGLRLALAGSFVIAIAAGMIAGNSGVGYYIIHAQQTLDISRMYAGAATVAVVGYLLNAGFLLVERKVLHWHLANDRARTGE
ncbi:ABC transporter permease [Aquamicrobium sp. LC103]|uniref:ABC transporter permease n=1 Tax=Aquamicrobium sp. LC103 TaxID=1120658 RepID=UPI00063EA6AB|nr:ABC transporter permease [Aquamicrobium sp. LC103]TKT69502.1 ABC transporter permease [Aquamicrobium sp. LC103]